MTRRQIVVSGLVFVLVLMGACTRRALAPDRSGAPNAGSVPVELPGSPEALPTVDFEGYRSLLSSLRGKPVVVNIWASWCGPCQDEAPLLVAAATAHSDVQFVGVDIQDSRDGAVAFIRRFAISYPSLFDPRADVRDGLGLPGQPDTLFYDSDGDLRSQILGPVDKDALDRGIANISR